MDKRKTYYIVLDTETCNGIPLENGKADLSQSLVYDCGWAVVDRYGNVYEQRSFVVNDTFLHEHDLMTSSYYADKLPQYYREIWDGSRTPVYMTALRRALREDCKTYNVKAIIAHNARFDYRALTNTQRLYDFPHSRYFFPYGIEIWDSQKMAHDTICKQPTYRKWCEDNGYMTKHATPRPRETAEVLYRYISGDRDFVEAHTGLADVMIEKDIFAKCMAQHKKMRKKLFED